MTRTWLYVINAKVHLNQVKLRVQNEIQCLEINCQNEFILALTNTGQFIMFSIFCEPVLLCLSENEMLPRPCTYGLFSKIGWPSLNSNEKGEVIISNGYNFITISMPEDILKPTAFIDSVMAKCQDFTEKAHGKSLEECYNVLAFLMTKKGLGKDQIKGYTKRILKQCLQSLKNLNYEGSIQCMRKIFCILPRLPLAFQFVAFFTRILNKAMPILISKLSKLTDFIQDFVSWTVSLESALNIRPRWLLPAVTLLYNKATKTQEKDVIEVITRHYAPIITEKIPRMTFTDPAIVSFHKGQYSKAIIKWQENALLGKDVNLNLCRVVQLLMDQKCFYDLAVFVSWVFTNFKTDIFDSFLVYLVLDLLPLKENPSVLLKMLLLRGKFDEASVLCQKLDLHKWKLLFQGQQKEQQPLIKEEDLDQFQPSVTFINELKEISNIFQLPYSFYQLETNFEFALNKAQDILEKEGLIFKQSMSESERPLMWAYIFLKIDLLSNNYSCKSQFDKRV